MKKNLLLLLLPLLFAKILFAQVPIDTIPPSKKDSIRKPARIVKDSTINNIAIDSNLRKTFQDSASLSGKDSSLIKKEIQQKIVRSTTIGLQEKNAGIPKRTSPGKELIFYSLIGLLLLFALLKNLFPKYFGDLFRLFFRTTLKQRQIREQLMQTSFASLAFNAFFVITAALYLDLLLKHFNLMSTENFWLLFFYCIIGLSIIYFLKYLGLKISGWLFNMKDAAESYIFIVFIINKMTGMYLLPFLILLSFMEGNLYHIFLILSWIGIGGLFIYRFILTFNAVHNQIRVNLFHFFLYLCAFEIAPLLLIYKLLLYFFR